MKKALWLSLVILFTLGFYLQADQREEPIDVIIALDKSLSMEKKIHEVSEYVNKSIIDEILRPGDFFLVVAFYGKTEVPVSMTIGGEADKAKAKKMVSAIMADGRFTDIGNALDVLKEKVEKYSQPERKKYLLLITDGIQEAPPGSKYHAAGGKFNHEFLANAKTIEKMGWKVQILGIGTFQAAKELAQELSGSYAELSAAPTSQEIGEKIQDFLAVIELLPPAIMSAVGYGGQGTLTVTLQSKGTSEEKRIEVSGIQLSLAGKAEQDILAQPVAIAIKAGEKREVKVPLQIRQKLPQGNLTGTIRFLFASADRFIPVVTEVRFQVKSFLENFWYWILAGIIAAGIVIRLLAHLAASIQPGSKVRFRLVVEGAAPAQAIYTLREGQNLFLDEAEGQVRVSRDRSPNSLARLNCFQKKLGMTLLKGQRFPKLHEVPANALDFSFRLRTESRKEVMVTFESLTKHE